MKITVLLPGYVMYRASSQNDKLRQAEGTTERAEGNLLRGFAEGAPAPVLRATKEVAQETEGRVRLHPLAIVLVPPLECTRLHARR